MYTFWMFDATNNMQPRHIHGGDWDNGFEVCCTLFDLDWFGEQYETLRSGGQVRLSDDSILVSVEHA